MVSTGGERDLWWSRPATVGRPPSETRRPGFTDLLDIPRSLDPTLNLSRKLSPTLLDHLATTFSTRQIEQIAQEAQNPLNAAPNPTKARRTDQSSASVALVLTRNGGGVGVPATGVEWVPVMAEGCRRRRRRR
jgi:hypothetical protein